MKPIWSQCFIGGSDSSGGGGAPAPVPQLPQQQAIPGLTMPSMSDIFTGAAQKGGGGFVNSPMPQTHGAMNASIAKMILALL